MKFKHITCPHDRYLVISDLDGTFLTDQGQITKENLEAVKALVEAGHVFCIATGRPWRSSKQFYDALKLNTLIANLNGSIIQLPYDSTVHSLRFVFSIEILKNLMASDDVQKLVDNFIIEDGHHLRVYKPIADHYRKELEEWFHTDFDLDPPIIGFDDFFKNRKTVNSILIQLSPTVEIDHVITLIKSRIKTLSCQLWSLKTIGHILEVNTVFTNKGNSLKYFSSFYGIPIERTVAFGDHLNDVSLLSKARYGYAMKNASTTAKFMAFGVTEFDNNNSGFAREIQKFFHVRDLMEDEWEEKINM